MREFAGDIREKLKPQAEQVVEHTLSALLTVAAIAALHVAVGWIAPTTGLAHDGDHDLKLWDFLPVRYIFDAGHFRGAGALGDKLRAGRLARLTVTRATR